MQKIQTRSTTHSSRYGFTMVEILVVIGILALLTALLVAAIAPALGNAKASATKATIAQLDRMVQDRLNAFVNTDMSAQADKLMRQYNGAGNSNPLPPVITLDVATILITKDRYKAAFPQCEVDLYGFNGVSDSSGGMVGGDDAPLLSYWNDSTAPNKASVADNSELFYLFLTQGQTFGIGTPNIDEINPQHIGDTDGDGRLEFLDAWGNPLWFYNAPTQLMASNSNALAARRKLFATLPTPLTQDPFDPLGRVSPFSSTFQNLTASMFKLLGVGNVQPINGIFYYDNDTYFAYLIVSAGPDGAFGLGDPRESGNVSRLAQPTNQDEIDDNITNRQH